MTHVAEMSDRLNSPDVATEALEFAWRKLPATMRFAVAPFGIATIVSFVVVSVVSLMAVALTGDGEVIDQATSFTVGVLTVIALVPLWILASSRVMVDVYRLVAKGEDTGSWFNIAIDGPVLRVAAAYFFMLFVGAFVFLTACLLTQGITGRSIAGAIGALGEFIEWQSSIDPAAYDTMPQPPPDLLAKIESASVLIVMAVALAAPVNLFFTTKLATLPPIAALENELALRRAFQMTQGHAWSVFGTMVLLFVASVAVSGITSLGTNALDFAASAFRSMGVTGIFLAVFFSGLSVTATIALQLFNIGMQGAFGGIVYRQLAD